MKTHKIIGAVEFWDDDDRKVGEVRGKAQRYAYAMAAAPNLLEACKFWLGAVQNSLALRLALADLPEGAGPALVEMLQDAIEKAEGE